jgi:hypothetical protein
VRSLHSYPNPIRPQIRDPKREPILKLLYKQPLTLMLSHFPFGGLPYPRRTSSALENAFPERRFQETLQNAYSLKIRQLPPYLNPEGS